jgi:hypothetical protein
MHFKFEATDSASILTFLIFRVLPSRYLGAVTTAII